MNSSHLAARRRETKSFQIDQGVFSGYVLKCSVKYGKGRPGGPYFRIGGVPLEYQRLTTLAPLIGRIIYVMYSRRHG